MIRAAIAIIIMLAPGMAWAIDDQELAKIERQFCVHGSCPDWVKQRWPDAGYENYTGPVAEPSENAKALAKSLNDLANQMERGN